MDDNNNNKQEEEQPRNQKEGFDESDDEHQILISKQNKQQTPSYFQVPDPNPLLAKNIIEINKPKVLIRQIQYFLEPEELLSSNVHKDIFPSDKSHNQKLNKKKIRSNYQSQTIWERYILSQNYQIVYLKYFREDISQIQRKGFKKFKLEIFRVCNNNTNLFSVYLIDLGFLSDYGSHLQQNLKPKSVKQILAQKIQSDIVFDSRFECGNLFAAFTPKETFHQLNKTLYEYDLILQSDVNTKGYSNWFYFSVRVKKKSCLKFNLVNMQKRHSLYTSGMKVAVFSFRKKQNQNLEWHRDGYNYHYSPSQLLKINDQTTNFSTLSFCYDAKYDDDLIFFAANIPYSYTKMLKYLENIEKIAKLNNNLYLKKQNIAMTISSNQCPILTLTWKRDKKKQKIKIKKKIIGVIARQHPSQTVSSYVMQGFINSLVHLTNESAVQLLQNYIFKIVPMANIDGVIYGNSRCDLSGTDTNRKWTRNPNKFMYPVVFAIRNLFNRLKMDDYQFDYFIDLHGHSRQLGSFVYGCKTYDQLEYKQLAWLMAKINTKFIFQYCAFGLSAFKKDTARGIMSQLALRKKALTVQTSFYGYRGSHSKHFEIKDLHRIGSSLMEAIYAESSRDPKMFNWNTIKQEMKEYLENMKAAKKSKNVGDMENSDISSDNTDSDSDPEADEMNDKQRTELFLDAVIASKIGINEVKVVDRSQRKPKQKYKKVEQEPQLKKYERIVDGFNEKVDDFVQNKQPSLIIQELNEGQQKLKRSKNFQIRQTKSVTKILPFKFSERPLKEQSPMKRSRKSVELKNRPQKLLKPEMLHGPEKKNNFWSNLKKQYEYLVEEKKVKSLHLNIKEGEFISSYSNTTKKFKSIQYL